MMIPHKHLIINIEGSPFILSIMTLFLGLLSVVHFSSQVWVKLIQMYSMHCFIDGLGNNGFTNPIISRCLESSSAYNPFSSRFPFLLQFIIAVFAGLTACIIYRPFYHLATMHVCKTVGIY